MRSLMRTHWVTITSVLGWLLLVVPVHAQVGDGFDLSWNTVDGGGGTESIGAGYAVGGTAGSPFLPWLSGSEAG